MNKLVTILAVLGAIALAIAAWMIGQRGLDPMKAVQLELDVLDAKTKAKRLLLNKNASDARRDIEREHKATIEAFNEDQKKQAEALADDPVALSAFLVRAGKRS